MTRRHRNYKCLFILMTFILVAILGVPTSCTTPTPTVILQEGTNLPKTQLQTKESQELEYNRIGSQWDSLWRLDFREIIDTEIVGVGLKRVRLAINGISFDTMDWSEPEFSIDPSLDDLITYIADNGVRITYVLTFWDKASWPGGEGANSPRFKTEEEIQRYLDFVRFIVRHFKDRVQYFQIWNEQDCDACGPQWIELADYVNLVQRAVPVIRQEYPEAKIVLGATCNLCFPEAHDYLFGMLRSDIMPLVDVVTWHPMYGASPEYDYYSEYYYEYPSIVQEIKDMASAHGFEGEYVAEEMCWRTSLNAIPEEPWIYSETVSAKYHARDIVMHLGMDIAVEPAVSAELSQPFATIKNLCTVMAGAKPANLPFEIESNDGDIRSYAFSLSNGDRLIALWTDGVAVDDDPGIEATLTLPSFSAQKVVGIDVLNGFEQELVMSTEDGNLVIENLLIRDYPIILRLIP